MENKLQIEITREDALNSINQIIEQKLYLPLFNSGFGYMIDEAQFFFYDYSPEQKKDLYTIAFALSNKLVTADDLDIESINKNASNMSDEFTNSMKSMYQTCRKPQGKINPNLK